VTNHTHNVNVFMAYPPRRADLPFLRLSFQVTAAARYSRVDPEPWALVARFSYIDLDDRAALISFLESVAAL
jgi:hypothetical protein